MQNELTNHNLGSDEYVNTLVEYRKLETKLQGLRKKERVLGSRISLSGLFMVTALLLWGSYLADRDGDSVFALLLFLLTAYIVIWGLMSYVRYPNKFNELRVAIDETNRNKDPLFHKLRSVEQPICDSLWAQLDDFYQTNLFRKRTAGSDFGESLAEFSSMVDEVAKVNEVFATTRVSLQEYREYLKKRQNDYDVQKIMGTFNGNRQHLESIRKSIRAIEKPQKILTLPPEKKYRVARKIENWDDLNKRKRLTGLKGEEIVVAMEQEYLESMDRNDLAENVRHVSKEDGDGAGYDVLSYFLDGKEKYIEVKSTTVAIGSPFYLSRNELGFLKEHQDRLYIYRVYVGNDEPQVRILQSNEVLEHSDIVPVQYLVRER